MASNFTLGVSQDGSVVDFGYLGQMWGDYDAATGPDAPARFDLAARRLELDPARDGTTKGPVQDGLAIEHWINSDAPTLDGRPLALEPYETSRSLAIHPDGRRFVLGTDWSLRAFDAAGEQLWRQPAPGTVWAVNVSGDGRLVVAAYGDGTIRWHRMDDGQELLAFFPLADRSELGGLDAGRLLCRHPGRARRAALARQPRLGRGRPRRSRSRTIAELRRPEVLPLVLQEMDTARALGPGRARQDGAAVQQRHQAGGAARARSCTCWRSGSATTAEAASSCGSTTPTTMPTMSPARCSTTQTGLYARGEAAAAAQRGGHPWRHPAGAGDACAAGWRAASRAATGGGRSSPATARWSTDELYLLPHEVDAGDPVGDQGAPRSASTTCSASCASSPSTAGCWCCSTPATRAQPRRRQRARGRRRPAAQRWPRPTSRC